MPKLKQNRKVEKFSSYESHSVNSFYRTSLNSRNCSLDRKVKVDQTWKMSVVEMPKITDTKSNEFLFSTICIYN